MKLKREFFERGVVIVARELLGCFLIHESGNGKIVGRIVETEAYGDATDLASHARFGNKGRSQIMFGPAGILYVYSIYGLFNLTNIICGQEGSPSAVLIRAVEIINGKSPAFENLKRHKYLKRYYAGNDKSSRLLTSNQNYATGPGKFSAAFGIDRTLNGIDIAISDKIFVDTLNKKPSSGIIETTRVGIDYAAGSKNLPWRFYIKGNKYISKR